MERKSSFDCTQDIDRLREIRDIIDVLRETFETYGEELETFECTPAFRMIVKSAVEEIGEASKDLSPQCRETYAHIVDWTELKNVRDRSAHSYRITMDLPRLWQCGYYYKESLRRKIDEIIQDMENSGTRGFADRELIQHLYSIYSTCENPIPFECFEKILIGGVETLSQDALTFWKTPVRYKRADLPLAFAACRDKTLPLSFPFWFDLEHNGETLIHFLVKRQTLPNDFPLWDAIVEGTTVAHLALEHGHLPSNFSHWGIRAPNGRTVAHDAVEFGALPKNFSRWGLVTDDGTGWTVAHEAANAGILPENFSELGLSDCNGLLVGILAVRNGYVPEDPAAWTIADVDGWTIAHEMARCHLLPNDFDLWYLKDRNGRSIADVMREVGDEPPFFDSSPSMRL